MATLDLVVAHHWFAEIASGRKSVEYRAMTPNWQRRIWQRREILTHVRFRRGYSRTSLLRRVVAVDVGPCPYAGCPGQYYRLHLAELPSLPAPCAIEPASQL